MPEACVTNNRKGLSGMKKVLALLVVLMMVFPVLSLAEESVQVYVSITDETGALVMAYEAVTVTDTDADGALTFGDALVAAHAAKHENGAEAFGMAQTEYGLSMTKLWGVENGGAYGYCLNDASAWSLLDPVAEGDHVKAYIYTDMTTWSDTYCYFAAPAAEVKAGETLELVLSANGYDANYAPVTFAVAEAQLAVNGEGVDIVTDAEGKAAISFETPGTYVVSAFSSSMTLVAPVCVVTVAE